MKLSQKITLVVLAIVTLMVAVSGYCMVSAGFRGELDSQVAAAASESRTLSLTLGTLLSQTRDRSREALAGLLERTAMFDSYELTVYHADGTILWSGGDHRGVLDPEDGEGGLCYRLIPGSPRLLETMQELTVGTDKYYVNLIREVEEPFLHRDDNLRTYRWIMTLSLAVSTLAAVLCARVLTGPIRKLSRTTRAMAQGQYSRRVHVRSKDELGALAEDFNAMADALERKIQDLADAAQRQRDFTASFAHELKTPLTSVIGYADTLRSRELPRKQQLEAVTYIFTEGKRLEAMSFALLDLFALERAEPQMQTVNARALAQAVRDSAQYPYGQAGVELKLSVAPGALRGEPNLLKTLLYNLLDNARKASNPGGQVWLKGRPVEGGYAFSVIDRGRGIPPEALNRITEPFYMVDKSRARAQGGAGLGLALCQRIAQAHGTALEYQSQVGTGTAVTIRLPAAEPPFTHP